MEEGDGMVLSRLKEVMASIENRMLGRREIMLSKILKLGRNFDVLMDS